MIFSHPPCGGLLRDRVTIVMLQSSIPLVRDCYTFLHKRVALVAILNPPCEGLLQKELERDRSRLAAVTILNPPCEGLLLIAIKSPKGLQSSIPLVRDCYPHYITASHLGNSDRLGLILIFPKAIGVSCLTWFPF